MLQRLIGKFKSIGGKDEKQFNEKHYGRAFLHSSSGGMGMLTLGRTGAEREDRRKRPAAIIY